MRDLLTRLLAVASLALLGTAFAAEPGPQAGEKFPDVLQAFDHTGREQNLETLMGEKGVALFFVRSADWCPFCMRQLADANQRLAEFQALGLNVVSVSVDKIPLIAKFAEAQSIGYTMLADPDGAISLKLGIRDEQYPVGSAKVGVPHPILYVIDSSGTIRLRYMEPTYRTRPDLGLVLRDAAALKL